jgi:hypothetical protein
MRASKRPYACVKRPCVFRRAEVYELFMYVSAFSVMTRLPVPSVAELSVRFV